jgi:hypothetical protein
MNTFQKMGGISSLICAATYLVSIGLLLTLLAPFADPAIGFAKLLDFFLANQATIFIWHVLMYLVNGVFLVILALALFDRLKAGSPALSQAATVFGLIWAALVFASGFITLYGWEMLAGLFHSNPVQAATLKLSLDMVTTGLDHSDRFLGCLWVLLVSWAALREGALPRPLNYLGLVIAIPGIISMAFPALTELGIAFGLGIIVWWTWLGIVLLRSRPGLVVEKHAAAGPAHSTLTFAGK